jgi:hypothetical protein
MFFELFDLIRELSRLFFQTVGAVLVFGFLYPFEFVFGRMNPSYFPEPLSTLVTYGFPLSLVFLGTAFLYVLGKEFFKAKLKSRYSINFAITVGFFIFLWILFSVAKVEYSSLSLPLIGNPMSALQTGLMIVGAFGVFSTPAWIIYGLVKKFKPKFTRRSILVASLIPFGMAIIMIGMFMSWENISGGHYNVLHAAIKNTCIIDPKKEHCPQKLEDLRIVEERYFDEATANAQMNYAYDPATNQYTFVVRYSEYNAIIFDQRLIPIYGLDLKEVKVTTIGQDRIQDPPNYAGPWTFPEWEKKAK